MKTIRTRFAPSPTGYLHIGGLRTALYNYLLAKKHAGQFILRIEDTDQTRFVPESVKNIIDNLCWTGINFDEGPGKGGAYGPYIQSERLNIYKKHAEDLIKKELAYPCFCSTERLDSVRQQKIALKLPPAYDHHCRNLSKEDVAKRLTEQQPHVIRMKVPLEGNCVFTDTIRGPVTIAYSAIDDQVLMKTDGFPTYHLAVVVDDHYMKISHIIRGEEWLPSTPKHVLLYKYFGWEAPSFSHLPLLLNPDKSKLSKRQGDVSVDDYRIKGYLPEALINFIALLGWNPGDGDTQEVFTLPELIQEFSLERVGKAGAIFNIDKLKWFNQQYILKLSDDQLFEHIKPLLQEKDWDSFGVDYCKKVIALLKDRAVTLPDFILHGEFFFASPTNFNPKDVIKHWAPENISHVKTLRKQFIALEPFEASTIEHFVKNYAQATGVQTNKLFPSLRLAITGVIQGPSVFATMQLLGKKAVLERIDFALKTITQTE